MIGPMRHGSPPRLLALQLILSPNRRESLPTPSAGVRITRPDRQFYFAQTETFQLGCHMEASRLFRGRYRRPKFSVGGYQRPDYGRAAFGLPARIDAAHDCH